MVDGEADARSMVGGVLCESRSVVDGIFLRSWCVFCRTNPYVQEARIQPARSKYKEADPSPLKYPSSHQNLSSKLSNPITPITPPQ